MKLDVITLKWISLLFFVFSVHHIGLNAQGKNGLHIIPAPNNVQFPGGISALSELKIYLTEDMDAWYYRKLFGGIKPVLWVNKNEANVLYRDIPELEKEGYRLEIKKDSVIITTGSKSGKQYALTSLAQLVTHRGFPLPEVIIEDSPRFSYRGMHLDVARHFFGVEDVKKHLDYMAYYKFNQFHWHLTDDQGWRIEIKKYPLLTQIAAYRKETLIGHYSNEPHRFDGKKYGGYYTQQEIRDVVAYAAARNINVIPEIEMPGHALAAIAAYPELACVNKTYEVATKWGVFDDVFCPNDVTFTFLEGVIDEVVALFPGKYIHIGGDECPKDAWKKSAFCQELIKRLGIKDEHELQSYFIQRMEKYINSKGRRIIGWDEIMEGGLAADATVMCWRGIQEGIKAARQNHEVIMTPGSHCYFDYYQSEREDEPVAIGGYTPLEKVYNWQPVPESLDESHKKYILGGQANLWSEYIPKYAGVEYMVYARGMAMSEVLWSRKKDYAGFLSGFERHHDAWKAADANIAFHVFDVKPIISAGEGKPVSVRFNVPAGAGIEYTDASGIRGTLEHQEPYELKSPGDYSFYCIKGNKKSAAVKLSFDLHLATSASITLENQPAAQYSANGAGSIVNGIKGSNRKYGGSEWLGFEGKNGVGILDFKKITACNSVAFRFYKSEGQWIYLPKKVALYASEDGLHFTPVASTENINAESRVAEVVLKTEGLKTRYLKFSVDNYGVIPSGSQGAGHGSWLFMDEITVK